MPITAASEFNTSGYVAIVDTRTTGHHAFFLSALNCDVQIRVEPRVFPEFPSPARVDRWARRPGSDGFPGIVPWFGSRHDQAASGFAPIPRPRCGIISRRSGGGHGGGRTGRLSHHAPSQHPAPLELKVNPASGCRAG